MALQLAIPSTETGDSYLQAYHRVSQLLLNQVDPSITIRVSIYRDQAARTARKVPVLSWEYGVQGPAFQTFFALAVLDLARHNPVAQAYAYLKTLPAYAGALDV